MLKFTWVTGIVLAVSLIVWGALVVTGKTGAAGLVAVLAMVAQSFLPALVKMVGGAPPGGDVIPPEAPTKPEGMSALKRMALGFGFACMALLALACGPSAEQAGVDSASNFTNLLADQECARQARQAATLASLSYPGEDASVSDKLNEKHARHVAALTAFDACESKKDGGL